jgi:cardiolipin synthase A/B
MSEDPSEKRRRWVTFGEIIALAALIVSGLGVWISWKSSDDDKPTRVVEQRDPVPLTLRARVADDGRKLEISPAEPTHVLESMTIALPGAEPIQVGSDGELDASAVEPSLKGHDKEPKDHSLSIRARVEAHYVEAGRSRRGGGVYTLRYRWEGGGLFGGRSLRLSGLSAAPQYAAVLGMMTSELIGTALTAVAEGATIIRALLRPHREPASRLAWIIAILALPLVGIILYLLLGETRISGPRRTRGREVNSRLPRPKGDPKCSADRTEGAHWSPFALAASVNGLDPTIGNSAHLAADSDTAIDEMVADIEAAQTSVHACFYIWLADNNGLKIKAAFIRAAKRGVAVRVLADALGSRLLIRSNDWREMRDAGCSMKVALPVGNPLWTVIRGRVDLRNHRKLLILDNLIAWCGSQNAADPEFRIKPRFAPWVDVMSRWSGPVARHCQYLFVSDWIAEGGDDISAMLTEPLPIGSGSIVAQVLGTGPLAEFDAMPACFSELIHSAREELVVTTPYFVPDEQLLFALTSAARRRVKTVMLFPRRNDNWIVAAASRSYYKDLIDAGAEIYEFRPGLLHSKTMVVDKCIGLIGSANLDRRSFELNFENNILFEDQAFASVLRSRQETYLKDCDRITREDVERSGIGLRLWQNLLATLSPML